MPQRPLLTAAWRNLLILNFPVPTDIIARLAPPGTEPDLHNGQSYISIVGFRFENVRLFGIPIPGHTNFPEINLRYYVRRTVSQRTPPRRRLRPRDRPPPRRRDRRQPPLQRKLRNATNAQRPSTSPAPQLSPNDTRSNTPGASEAPVANHDRAAHVAAPLALPAPGSLEEFIIEHYWGYTHGRAGQTGEYQVAHVPWRIAAADNVTWDCDIAANYNPPLAEFLATPPTSAFIAEGSAIQVFRGAKCYGGNCLRRQC